MAPYGSAGTEEEYLLGRESAVQWYRARNFEQGTFSEIPVQWGEMDSNMHLNNVTYARYLEAGRLQFWRYLASQIPEEAARALVSPKPGAPVREEGLILAGVTIDYLLPTFSPDTVIVAHRPVSFSTRKVVIEASVYSFSQKAQVARGTATMVAYNYGSGKTSELHPGIIQWLKDKLPEGADPSRAKL